MLQTVNKQPEYYPEIGDEIDLMELFSELWRQRWMVVQVAGGIFLLALLYVFFGPKSYEVDAGVLPPDVSAMAALSAPGVEPVSPDSVYNVFVENLISPDVYLQVANQTDGGLKSYFYDDEGVSNTDVLKDIKDSISIDLPKEPKNKLLVDNAKLTRFSFMAADPKISYAFVNNVVKAADAMTVAKIRNDILAELNRDIGNKQKEFALKDQALNEEKESEIERLLEQDRKNISEIDDQINSLKEKAQADRESRIVRLTESLGIAKKLGIKTPVNPSDYQKTALQANAKIDVASSEPSGYWLGTKILSAEIAALRSRKDDAAYVSELTDLRKKLKLLATNERVNMLKSRKNNLPFSEDLRTLNSEIETLKVAVAKIMKAKFDVFKYTEKPIIPSRPVKPKKLLVLFLALVLGVIVGIAAALLRSAIQKHIKAKQAI